MARARGPSHGMWKGGLDRYTVADTGCWLWGGTKLKNGYGTTAAGGKTVYVHRAMYERERGVPIPTGMTIDHLCRVRLCINPAHLEVVTLAENLARGQSTSAVNRRKTVCKRGHGLSPRADGDGRQCRTCARDAAKTAYWKEKRERNAQSAAS